MALVIPFLNEEHYLGTLLESISSQSRQPDELLLVDDGSADDSASIATEFAAQHPYCRVLRRDARPSEQDRLARAAELVAFQWAVEKLVSPYEIVAKLDADLRLTPEVFAAVEDHFLEDPGLGLAGPFLSVVYPTGGIGRERCPPDHVRGATKFYRRECYEQIVPLPATLGWDTLDEVKARMHGWRTASFSIPGGDPLHLRPTGVYDGALRSYRRSGLGTYAYGAHPLHVVLRAVRRIKDPPPVLGALNFLFGWANAALRRVPRAEPEVRAFVRREQLRRIRNLVLRRSPG